MNRQNIQSDMGGDGRRVSGWHRDHVNCKSVRSSPTLQCHHYANTLQGPHSKKFYASMHFLSSYLTDSACKAVHIHSKSIYLQH